jgi:hypothetical protein
MSGALALTLARSPELANSIIEWHSSFRQALKAAVWATSKGSGKSAKIREKVLGASTAGQAAPKPPAPATACPPA